MGIQTDAHLGEVAQHLRIVVGDAGHRARVAIGAHVVTVVPDNLPLPWFVDEDGDRRAVEVKVRDQQRVDIGARRQR